MFSYKKHRGLKKAKLFAGLQANFLQFSSRKKNCQSSTFSISAFCLVINWCRIPKIFQNSSVFMIAFSTKTSNPELQTETVALQKSSLNRLKLLDGLRTYPKSLDFSALSRIWWDYLIIFQVAWPAKIWRKLKLQLFKILHWNARRRLQY